MKKRISNHLLFTLRREGLSIDKIAILCGTTPWSIRNWLKEAEQQRSDLLDTTLSEKM